MKQTIRHALFFLCCLLLCSAGMQAQKKEALFPFAYAKQKRATLQPVTGYKYEVALAVFNNLLRARGDSRQQAPTLAMNNGEQYMAWMAPESVQVGIEERAYDVCASFGADSLSALAVLLAHELIHYYEKHDWSRNFAHLHKGFKTLPENDRSEGVKQEIQADYLGGFLAFSAGYNGYGLMPRLLERLYQSYGIPTDLPLPSHPKLAERVALSHSAMSQLKELQTVFETARFLTAIENYEDATLYYRHILDKFQSREVYNNAGINSALAALSYYAETEMPYVLPFEIDPTSRLYNLKGMQAERIKLRQELLTQALGQFERALHLDPAYTLGYLNKASVHVLAGEWDDAEFWIRKGKATAEGPNTAGFTVLEAIIAALRDDNAQAQRLLSAAIGQGSNLADLNMDILLGMERTAPRQDAQLTREMIDGLSINEFMAQPDVDKEISITELVICGAKNLPGSKVWLHYANDGRQYALVHWCGENSRCATQKGVRSGDHADEITRAYGQATRVLAYPKGTIWVYPNYGLLFLIGEHSLVHTWGTYRKSA